MSNSENDAVPHQPGQTKIPSYPARLLGYLYGLSAFLIASAIWPYFVIFLGNLRYRSSPWIEPTIDVGPSAPIITAAAINIALIALFGLQHSLMARTRFKKWLARFIPPGLERQTYVHGSNIAMIALFVFWHPIPIVIWDAGSGPAKDVLWGIFALGWIITLAASASIDLFHLWGLRHSWAWYQGREYVPPPFKERWMYRYVRHPIYFGILIGFWATPYMTVGHALLATGMTLYILIGMRYEEAGLIARHGDSYRKFQRTVPALIPLSRGLPRKQG